MVSTIVLNDTNIKQSCRTCLKLNAEEMISIFDKIDQVENDENVNTCIFDMLMDVTLIELDRKENLPTLICINCLRLAQLLFNFRRQCNRSQAILLKYLTEKAHKATEMLGTKKNSNQQQCNILNKKSAINKLIDANKSINEATPKSIIAENELQEFLSHSSSKDDSFNAAFKLDFIDESYISDTEKEDKVMGTLSTRKIPNCDSNVLSKSSAIKESMTNDVNELSNPSCSDDLLNASIKLEIHDEIIIKSEIESECEESLHSKVFTCHLCDDSFKTETLYFAHTKQHTGEKYACNQCNKSFSRQKSLNAHMRRHSENRHESHVCDICGKHFDHRKYLIAHLQTHRNEKRFSCKICGKKFKQSGSVAPHMRIHTKIDTDDRPHVCLICGKKFLQAHCLRSHFQTHVK